MTIKIELPDEFLEEEVRCGYTVSAGMKKLWAVEMDLLVEFDRVCKKHNLTYFLDGGTLLGAIRHKGFIPWDDDIDVIMHRRDYEKLVQIADQEFQHPYFLQTPYTDPGIVMGGSRLRNSDTTLISDYERKRPFQNKGIFIDIFVLDNIPDNDTVLKNAKLFLKYYWRILRYASYYEDYFQQGRKYTARRMLLGKLSILIKRVLGIQKLSRGYEKYCCRWSNKDTQRIAPLECYRGKYIFPRDWYSDAVTVPFEHINVPIPNGYEGILTAKYGEYMVMKQMPTLHRALVFDAESPYSEYFSWRDKNE